MATYDLVTGRRVFIQRLIDLFPKNFRLRLNPRRYAIETFVKKSSLGLPAGTRILDAGAGPCPYKPMFVHCKYEATDFEDPHEILDFVCSLDKIPKRNNTYDAIICTEVLEHVEYPQKVMRELYRILKKNGKLILTVPQGWMMHQKPYNFYYFTYYGLESLLKHAGFKNYKIEHQGGYFWFLGDAIKFNSLVEQLKNKYRWLYYFLSILEYPFTQIILPLICFHLDRLDKRKDWTMGYTVVAVK